MKKLLAMGAFVALALPVNAFAGSSMYIGAVENAPLQADPVAAKAKVDLARLAGFNALRMGVFWGPGRGSVIPASDLQMLQNASNAAQLDGMRLILSVSNYGSRTTPLTPRLRDDFSQYAAALARALPSVTDFIIGNEPNLNRFWMPQFAKVKGRWVDAAAPAYFKLLAQTYDSLKRVNPDINVMGVALSPRGGDDPTSIRPTHSPVTFMHDLGRAYRVSHRAKPIMDSFAFHPYLEKSSTPVTFRHPKSNNIGLADYDKVRRMLAESFRGTAQPGATLPIVYDEYGVQSQIPAAKQGVYANLGTRAAQDAVSEAKQAAAYKQAFKMAYCQKNVAGILIFHVSDESDANAWQSGVFYADDTPKASLAAVREAAVAAANGTLAKCPGVVKVEQALAPNEDLYSTANTMWQLSLTCAGKCSYLARVESFPNGSPALEVKGNASPGQKTTVTFPKKQLSPGTYRFSLRIYASTPPASSRS